MKKIVTMSLMALAASTQLMGAIKVTGLSVEGRNDQPIGLDAVHPKLSWQIATTENEKDIMQTSYHILVASNPDTLKLNRGDLWDIQKESDQSIFIPYAGKKLKPNQRIYWKVQISTNKGFTGWSDVSTWTTGLLNESHWQGQWIGLEQAMPWDIENEHSRLSARYYRCVFDKCQKKVKRATLHIAGLGLYDAFINGTHVGNNVMTPVPTDYNKTIVYNTYDVTQLLNGPENRKGKDKGDGRNCIAVVVSNGHYYATQQNENRFKITNFGYPTLKADLIIEYADGKSEVISTDTKNWKVSADGGIRSANDYDGEIYDANKEQKLWYTAAFNDSVWKTPEMSRRPNGRLVGNLTPAMKVAEQLKVKKLETKPDGRIIADFGQNFVGRVRVRLINKDKKHLLQKGDTLRIRLAERLSADGELYTANLRDAQATDYYISDGEDINMLEGENLSETWAPRFTTHGFRYAEITVLASSENMAASDANVGMTEQAYKKAEQRLSVAEADFQYMQGLLDRSSNKAKRKLYQQRMKEAKKSVEKAMNNKTNAENALAEARQNANYENSTVLEDSLFKETAFIGEVICDEMERAGKFESSNEMLNKLMDIAYWTIISNYKGIPIDCPQRDERQAWLGDHAIGCWGESFLLNNHALYNKWADDIAQAQRADGCIPDVAPAYWNIYTDNVSWPSAFIFVADMLYRQYGDASPIIRNYDAMREWIMHIHNDKSDNRGLIVADEYGDWCVTPESRDLIHTLDPKRKTDGVLIGSCYYYKLLELMAAFDDVILQLYNNATPEQRIALDRRGITASVLNADRNEYEQIRQSLGEAINKEFLHVKEGSSPLHTQGIMDCGRELTHILYPDSIYYGNNTVTGNLLPLAFGLVPNEYEDAVSRQVYAKLMLKPADGHLTCGAIGVQWLMRELSKRGRMDIAYLLATQKTYPSWGYMVDQGATTFWELWNGDTANPEMSSENHLLLVGDLIIWGFENVGGIRQKEPGYKKICLAPNFELEELSSADVSYNSPYGTITSKWKKSLTSLVWDIVIPANTTAEVVLPTNAVLPQKENTTPKAAPKPKAKKQKGNVREVRQEPLPDNVLVLGSGIHHLEYKLDPGKGDDRKGIIRNEFLFEKAPFATCHSASLAELPNGDLLAAFYGGTATGADDCCIYTSRKRRASDGTFEEGWSEPVKIVDGVLNDSVTKACYNPVLYQVPGGDLLLFFKLGKNVCDWSGYLMRSSDNGATWYGNRDLIVADHGVAQDSLLGATKNKPIVLPAGFRCADGTVLQKNRILAPSSKETATGTKDAVGQWRCYIEYSENYGHSWNITKPVPQDNKHFHTVQPTLLVHSNGRIQMLCRTAKPSDKNNLKYARIATSFSEDGGLTWSQMQLIDDLPNNNSGIDAVTLADGTFALAYNPFGCVDWRETEGADMPLRNPLCIATSEDGLEWKHFATLESSPVGQYSYPAIILGTDGTLHCIYSWRGERIKYQQIQLKEPKHVNRQGQGRNRNYNNKR